MADVRFAFCPYCNSHVLPGQEVVHVKDDDPSRALWHKRCREMWEYDERLAAEMSKPRP